MSICQKGMQPKLVMHALGKETVNVRQRKMWFEQEIYYARKLQVQTNHWNKE